MNLARFFALTLAAGLMLPVSAWAVPSCEKIAQGPNSVEACRDEINQDVKLKSRYPAVYKLYSSSVGELCASNSSAAGIDNHRCEGAVQKLKELLDQRKQKMVSRCDQRVEQVKACQACANNLSARGCQDEDAKMYQKFNQFSSKWRNAQQQLAQRVKKVEDEMFKLSEDYADNIADLQRDVATHAPQSSAASDIGAGTAAQGLSMHGGASPADIYRAVQEFQNASDISKDDMQEAQSIPSKYAKESLSRALEAKAARLQMEKEIKEDKAGNDALAQNTKTLNQNSEKLGSVDSQGSPAAITSGTAENGAGALSGLAGLGAGGSPAASGTIGSGGIEGAAAGANSGGTYDPRSAALGAAALNSMGAGGGAGQVNSPEAIGALGPNNEEGNSALNVTGGSRAGSLRDSLRAKLAGMAGAGTTSASEAAKASAAGAAAESKGKPGASQTGKAGELLTGFAPEDLTSGSVPFEMAPSETDAAVQEMIADFQGEGEFTGARHLASAGKMNLAPEILAEDSSDLFERTREFYDRCQKRGCVTR